LARSRHVERWLWPDLPSLDQLNNVAPARLKLARERREWADGKVNEAIETRRAALQAELDRSSPLAAVFADGELKLLAGGAPS
jgi:hypothetical protein